MLSQKSVYTLAVLAMAGLFTVGGSMLPGDAGSAYADEQKKGLKIMGAYARASLGMLKNSAGFMSVINHGDKADRLVGAKSAIAKRVELHTHIKQGNIMKMRKIDAIDVPAQGFVDLEPGSHHIMFIGLHKPLKAGEKFSLTLVFEKGGEKTVEVMVKGLKAASHADHHRGSNSGAPAPKEPAPRGSH